MVSSIAERTSVDTDSLLLMGAEARNLLHAARGHTFRLRSTTDLDLGLAVPDWHSYDELARTYARTGSTGIRYRIEGVIVDVMPFGEVEDPQGITLPPRRGEALIVFGFNDVFARSELLTLPSGITIRLPSAAGYGALKMRAFIDQSVYGQEKDAQDLALVAYWYQEDPMIDGQVWSLDNEDLMDRLEWDGDLGKAFLLGVDIGSVLSAENRVDLLHRWAGVDAGLLVRSFTFGRDDLWTRDLGRRGALLDQIARGIAGGIVTGRGASRP